MTTHFISDLHLGHAKVINPDFEAKYRPFETIEEHDQGLVDNWNSVVGEKDTVWVLGDVAFTLEGLAHMGQMKGKKKLVLGNHDRFPIEAYLKHFKKVYGTVAWKKKTVLTHVPIHTGEFRDRFSLNLHGHLHSKSVKVNVDGKMVEDWRYLNVSVERINLRPVSWDVIKEGYNL